MASTTSISSNYAGFASADYISAALFEGKTLSMGLINIIPNIKHKFHIQKVDFSNDLVQAYAATFNDTSTLTHTERTLDPTDLMVNFKHDIKAYEAMWDAERMTAGAGNSQPSPTLQSYILNQMGKQTSQIMEFELWRGNMTGNSVTISGYTKFDGLLRVIDQASPQRVSATTLTKSNILYELGRVYDSWNSNVSQIPALNAKLFVPVDVPGMYNQAIASGNSAVHGYYIGDKPMDFLGVELIPTPGLPSNFIVMAEPKNLYFGTDLTSDMNSVRLVDMRDTTADYNFRYRADFKAGTQVAVGAQIVFYKP